MVKTDCRVCGTRHDELTGTVPACPTCFEFACAHPVIFNFITKVAANVVEIADYNATGTVYYHNKNNKHEVNAHYRGV